MRDCYTALLRPSACSVVNQSYKETIEEGSKNKKVKVILCVLLHIGIFRRKVGYKNEFLC